MAAAGVVLVLVGGSAAWALSNRDTDEPAGGGGGEPEAADVTPGDLDGDGYGDAALFARKSLGDPVALWRMTSTGKALGTPTDTGVETGKPAFADVDGDGVPDEVWISGFDFVSGNAASIRVVLSDGTIHEQTLEGDEDLLSTVEPMLTDVTGDGREDLVLDATEPSGERHGLHVAVSDGEGFEEPVQWWAGEAELDLIGAGDLDGDGETELASLYTEVNDDYTKAEMQVRLVDVEDETFVVGESVVPGETWLPASGKVGDVDGDGTDDVVLIGGERNRIGVAHFTDGLLGEPVVWRTPKITQKEWEEQYEDLGPINPAQLTLSDVDGDGDSDIVYHLYGRDGHLIEVIPADGDAFGDPQDWLDVDCALMECRFTYGLVE